MVHWLFRKIFIPTNFMPRPFCRWFLLSFSILCLLPFFYFSFNPLLVFILSDFFQLLYIFVSFFFYPLSFIFSFLKFTFVFIFTSFIYFPIISFSFLILFFLPIDINSKIVLVSSLHFDFIFHLKINLYNSFCYIN